MGVSTYPYRVSDGRETNESGKTDLEETEIVQESSNVVDDPCSLDEHFSSFGIHDEIQISLSMPLLLILEPEVLLGKLVQIRGEQDHRRRRDGQFGLLCSKRFTSHSDNVSSSEDGMEGFEVFW